ncbi:MAG: hypothetical protein FJ125_18435, partial [Deltaproteobacteria bacterium]|nr:hypothetical protein [Deltaproteobacteria bacterium]
MEQDIQGTLNRLAANPEDEQALELLESQCLQARRLDILVKHYESRTTGMDVEEALEIWNELGERIELMAEDMEEAEARAEALFVAGELFHRKTGRLDRAMVLFQQSFRTWTGLTQALDSAREIYRSQDNHRMVVKLFELQSQVTEDSREAAELCFQAGQVLLDALGDREAAVDSFRKALELQPGHPRYEEALSFLEAVEQNWERVVQRFVEEAEGATDPTLACSLYLRAAETLLEHDGDRAEVTRLARLAVQRSPKDDRAAELFRRAAPPPVDEEQDLQARIATIPPGREKVELTHRMARLRAEVGDVEGAVSHLVGLLQEVPLDGATVEELARTLAAADRLGELGDLLEDSLR